MAGKPECDKAQVLDMVKAENTPSLYGECSLVKALGINSQCRDHQCVNVGCSVWVTRQYNEKILYQATLTEETYLFLVNLTT